MNINIAQYIRILRLKNEKTLKTVKIDLFNPCSSIFTLVIIAKIVPIVGDSGAIIYTRL